MRREEARHSITKLDEQRSRIHFTQGEVMGFGKDAVETCDAVTARVDLGDTERVGKGRAITATLTPAHTPHNPPVKSQPNFITIIIKLMR